jgi:ribosomal protein L37AE/L43A
MSLRDKLLSLLGQLPAEPQESNPATPPIIAVRVESAPERKGGSTHGGVPEISSDACPRCGSAFTQITASIRRCQQCGRQERFEPPRPAPVPPFVVKPAKAPGTCPCGSELVQAVGGGGWRCAQCGVQAGVERSNGLSRKDLESYEGKPAHVQMNGSSFFYRALVGIQFGRR